MSFVNAIKQINVALPNNFTVASHILIILFAQVRIVLQQQIQSIEVFKERAVVGGCPAILSLNVNSVGW